MHFKAPPSTRQDRKSGGGQNLKELCIQLHMAEDELIPELVLTDWLEIWPAMQNLSQFNEILNAKQTKQYFFFLRSSFKFLIFIAKINTESTSVQQLLYSKITCKGSCRKLTCKTLNTETLKFKMLWVGKKTSAMEKVCLCIKIKLLKHFFYEIQNFRKNTPGRKCTFQIEKAYFCRTWSIGWVAQLKCVSPGHYQLYPQWNNRVNTISHPLLWSTSFSCQTQSQVDQRH